VTVKRSADEDAPLLARVFNPASRRAFVSDANVIEALRLYTAMREAAKTNALPSNKLAIKLAVVAECRSLLSLGNSAATAAFDVAANNVSSAADTPCRT
jgi:hypothetical protein